MQHGDYARLALLIGERLLHSGPREEPTHFEGPKMTTQTTRPAEALRAEALAVLDDMFGYYTPLPTPVAAAPRPATAPAPEYIPYAA